MLLSAWTVILFFIGVIVMEQTGIRESWAMFNSGGDPAPDPDRRGELCSPAPDETIETFLEQDPRLTDIQLDREQALAMLDLRGQAPRILIYHTHTTEAYTQTPENPYEQAGDWRTRDNTKNVVAVGEALALCLREVYGFTVLHDTTDHEPPKLATAYERSEATMRRIRQAYPSIELCIDLHRDSYTVTDKPTTDFVALNGAELARIMLVTGQGFETSYALAQRITERLQSIDARLARPIREKTGRYNQHITDHCILVELGHNANTLEQALASVPYLAEAIAVSLVERQKKPALNWAPV